MLKRRTALRSRGKKALRRLKKLAEEMKNNEKTSPWEREFLDGQNTPADRIETFGRAFADPELGNLEQPLSQRQWQKVREMEEKSKRVKEEEQGPNLHYPGERE